MQEAFLPVDHEPASDLASLIAAAADVCRKPLRHAVVLMDEVPLDESSALSPHCLLNKGVDLRFRLECREPQGSRCPGEDLELEMYRSGDDLNLMLGWWEQPERPLLWHGQHPVWMDGHSGQRCAAPKDASPLEALARRLRALLSSSVANPC